VPFTKDYYGYKIKKNEMACSMHWRDVKSTVLAGKPVAKRLIVRHSWKCNIKVVCKEIGCEKVHLIYLDRVGFSSRFCEHSGELTKGAICKENSTCSGQLIL
jgi:hypothetical protein